MTVHLSLVDRESQSVMWPGELHKFQPNGHCVFPVILGKENPLPESLFTMEEGSKLNFKN